MKRIFNFGIIAIMFALLAFSGSAYSQDSSSPPTFAQYAEVNVPDPPLSIDQILIQDSIEASKLNLVPFRSKVIKWAREYYLPPSLLAAFCDVESDWKPRRKRKEPHYMNKAVLKNGARAQSRTHGGIPTYPTELDDRSSSFGLMQTMGQLAREQGFAGQYLSELHNPDSSLKQGAIKLRSLLTRYRGDSLSMISAYNQGNNRQVNGTFENARYVYKLNVKWNRYKTLFNDRKLLIGAKIDTSIPSYNFASGDNDWFWDQVRSSTAKDARAAIAERTKLLEDSIVREREARHSDSIRYANAVLSDRGTDNPPSDVSAITVLAPIEEDTGLSIGQYVLLGFGCIAAAVLLFGLNNTVQGQPSDRTGYSAGMSLDRSGNVQGSVSGGVTTSAAPIHSSTSVHRA